eukprot:sb/3469356/
MRSFLIFLAALFGLTTTSVVQEIELPQPRSNANYVKIQYQDSSATSEVTISFWIRPNLPSGYHEATVFSYANNQDTNALSFWTSEDDGLFFISLLGRTEFQSKVNFWRCRDTKLFLECLTVELALKCNLHKKRPPQNAEQSDRTRLKGEDHGSGGGGGMIISLSDLMETATPEPLGGKQLGSTGSTVPPDDSQSEVSMSLSHDGTQPDQELTGSGGGQHEDDLCYTGNHTIY